MAKTLRVRSKTGWVTKDPADLPENRLTAAEVDDNFLSIEDAVENVVGELAASDGASLVGFQQTGTGAVVRTAQDKLREMVSVKDFGAVGDGVADDSNAIEAAIAVPNRRVVFPPGVYLISSTLTPASGVTMTGDRATIQVAVSTTATFPLLVISSKSDVSVENLTFDGAQSVRQTGAAVGGLFIQNGSQRCSFKNLVVKDVGIRPLLTPSLLTGTGSGNALSINSAESDTRDSSDNVIENCRVDDTGGQLSFGIRLTTDWTQDITPEEFTRKCRNNRIANNTILGTTWNAIEIAGPATVHNIIDGNRSIGSLGNTGIEADKGASYNTFSNNHVEDAVYGTTHNNCAFRTQGATAGASYPARYARGNVWVNNVASNNRKAATKAAVGMLIDFAEQTSIMNLTIRDTDVSGSTSDSVRGIQIYDASHTVINGLQVFESTAGPEYNGIVVNERVTDLAVENSMIQQPATLGVSGVRVSTAVQRFSLNGCTFINGESGLILATNATISDGRIIGNTFSGQTYAPVNANSLATSISGVIIGNTFDVPATVAMRFTEGQPNLLIHSNVTNKPIVNNTDIRLSMFGNRIVGATTGNYGSNAVTSLPAAPVAGEWVRGDIVYNSAPSNGGSVGWVCTAGGTPGTWKEFGTIAT